MARKSKKLKERVDLKLVVALGMFAFFALGASVHRGAIV